MAGSCRAKGTAVSRISGCAAGFAFALLLAGVTQPSTAQAPTAQAPPTDTGAAMPGRGGPRRQMLEQRVRERFEQIVRQRLQLTDDQMQKLRQTNQRFAVQRRALTEQERGLRSEIRRELQPGVAANQTHVAALTDSLFAIQRQRLDMAQSEQKELATYLSPVQRVRFYGLQEQLRRRLEMIRQRRQGVAPGASPPP
jgi:flagellar biosynthesis GTPase FlhF